MSLATIPFPVPVSPAIRTVELIGATARSSSRRFLIDAVCPTRSSPAPLRRWVRCRSECVTISVAAGDACRTSRAPSFITSTVVDTVGACTIATIGIVPMRLVASSTSAVISSFAASITQRAVSTGPRVQLEDFDAVFLSERVGSPEARDARANDGNPHRSAPPSRSLVVGDASGGSWSKLVSDVSATGTLNIAHSTIDGVNITATGVAPVDDEEAGKTFIETIIVSDNVISGSTGDDGLRINVTDTSVGLISIADNLSLEGAEVIVSD